MKLERWQGPPHVNKQSTTVWNCVVLSGQLVCSVVETDTVCLSNFLRKKWEANYFSLSGWCRIKRTNFYLRVKKLFRNRIGLLLLQGELFVQRQPCARNDRLALGRPHMGLISHHFSFILSWQNNGCLWRVSYPLLFLSPRPECLSLRWAELPGHVRRDRLKFPAATSGCGWIPPVPLFSRVSSGVSLFQLSNLLY